MIRQMSILVRYCLWFVQEHVNVPYLATYAKFVYQLTESLFLRPKKPGAPLYPSMSASAKSVHRTVRVGNNEYGNLV